MPHAVGQDLKPNDPSGADNALVQRKCSPSSVQVVRPAPVRPPYASNALAKRFPELFLPEQLLINTLGGRQRLSAYNYHQQAQLYGYGSPMMGTNLQTNQTQQDENGCAVAQSQEPLLRRLSARTPRDNGIVTNFRRFSAIKSFKERSTMRNAGVVANNNNIVEMKVNGGKPLLTIEGSLDLENIISEEENSSLATISLPHLVSQGSRIGEGNGEATITEIDDDKVEKTTIVPMMENLEENSKMKSSPSSNRSTVSRSSKLSRKTLDDEFPLPPPEMVVESASLAERQKCDEHLLITYQANLLNMATDLVCSATNSSSIEPVRKLSRVNDRVVISNGIIEETPEESSHNLPLVVSTVVDYPVSTSNNNGNEGGAFDTLHDRNNTSDGDDDRDLHEMTETHPATSSNDEDEDEDEETSISENKLCTSFRIKIPYVRNPVDLCVLPDDYFAIADYSNGLVIIGPQGTLIAHKNSIRDVNACGVGALRLRSSDEKCTLLVLVCQNSTQWKINFYEGFLLTQAVDCPEDGQIESWALRRVVVAAENTLYLLASGEYKSCIWTLNLYNNSWTVCFSQYKKWCGIFSDLSIRCCRLLQNVQMQEKSKNKHQNKKGKEKPSKNCSSIFDSISLAADTENKFVRFLLCDWRKARLKNFVLNHKGDEIYSKTVKVRRRRCQQWIVDGPVLSALDDKMDIIVYDASGKIFLFDGVFYKLKKIIADVGKGEVTSLIVKDDWLYVLCRQKLCIEAYLYRDDDT